MPKRTDRNQRELMALMRQLGFEVQDISMVGHGCPDVLASRGGVNYLFEIKNPAQPPSGRKLTSNEQEFGQRWKAPVYVIMGLDDLLRLCDE